LLFSLALAFLFTNFGPAENVLPIDITKEEAWGVSVKYTIDEEELRKGRLFFLKLRDINNDYFIGKEKMSRDNPAYDVHSTRDLKVTTDYFDQYFVVYLPIYFSNFEYNGQVYEVCIAIFVCFLGCFLTPTLALFSRAFFLRFLLALFSFAFFSHAFFSLFQTILGFSQW
jgi:hypothetical protein